MELDIKRVQSNIRYLVSINNEHMGDFEESLGVSRGFFSRMGKTRNSLTVNLIADIAKRFNVSIDDLVYKDLTKEIKDGEETEL